MSDSPRRLLAGLVLIAGLAACSSGTTGTPPIGASPPSEVPAPSVTFSEVPAPTTSASATLGSSTPGSSTGPATQGQPLPLTLSRTGGIAGVQDKVEVGPDGTATVTDRSGNTKKSHLSSTDLATLRRLVADPALAREAKTPDGAGTCADGFQYYLRTPGLSIKTTDCGRSTRPTLTKIIGLVLPPGGK